MKNVPFSAVDARYASHLETPRYPEFLALGPHAKAETNVDYAEDYKRSELKFFRWIFFTSARFTNVGALFDTNGGPESWPLPRLSFTVRQFSDALPWGPHIPTTFKHSTSGNQLFH